MRRAAHALPLSLLASIAALSVCGCADGGPPAERASGTVHSAGHGKAPAVRAKVPLDALIAQARADVQLMHKIWDHDFGTGRALGKLNSDFQQSAFFSRIPSIPAVEALKAEVGRLASLNNLILEDLRARVPPDRAAPPRVLGPGERWRPTDDELFAPIELEIDLQGPIEAAARFIDAVPTGLERLVVVTADRARSGGVRLLARCWYERSVPMPQLDLPWLEVEQRLRAAGYDPDDPGLADDPKVARLSTIVDSGRRRMNDIKNTLAVAADFPRWFARAKFFEARQIEAQAVKGAELLGSIAGK